MLKSAEIDMAYRYFLGYTKDPRISKEELHREYSNYKSKKATTGLLKRAIDDQVIVGPKIWCNTGFEVTLIERGKEDPLDLFETHESDPNVSYAMALEGAHLFLAFKKGACILKYGEAVKPTYPAEKTIFDIELAEKGELPVDLYPSKWEEVDWKIYELMRYPSLQYWKVGQKVDQSWQTVKRRFLKILEQCKIWTAFYPLGFKQYSQALLTFKTEYELNLRNELQKIDRTSFLFKYDDMLLLFLMHQNSSIHYMFSKLEKEGKIHDLHVSIPVKHLSRL